MAEINLNILEGEAGFRVLFKYASISIIVVNESGKIELMNPYAEELFGYSKGELIGQSIEELLPKEHRDKHVSHREIYFEKPKARTMGQGLDLYGQKKDGTIFPVEISLGHYEFGGEKLAVAFVSDISKRKAAENDLRKNNESLEKTIQARTLELTEALEREKELGEMKSRFVSMASHEFRTPLSAVLSSISLIDNYIATGHNEKTVKHVDRIKSSIKNLTNILDDFLSLDKLEQGKVEVEKTTFNIQEFMEDMIEEVRGMRKPEQNILLKLEGEKEVFLDKKIMRNVMLNLLSNAIKYSGDGKEINVDVMVGNPTTSISVKDHGIGIPEEEQQNLFGKFFRARNSGNIQGTGLGLNIVKHYVGLLNGTISFTSKANQGTTFIIEFNQNNK